MRSREAEWSEAYNRSNGSVGQKLIVNKCGSFKECLELYSYDGDIFLIAKQCPYYTSNTSKSYSSIEEKRQDKNNRKCTVGCSLPNSLEFINV